MTLNINRREFFGFSLGAAIATTPITAHAGKIDKVKTSARIVILGAGAAGAAIANRLNERLDGAKITIIDGREQHWYQPGFTLVAAGLKPANYVTSKTTDWLPKNIELIAKYATEIDADAKKITVSGNEQIAYDYLLVTTGLKLDWDAIEGFSLDMVGKDGIGAVYAGPEYAAKTWGLMDAFTEKGGDGLFFRPATEMKCAGAPLKYTLLTDDYARQKNNRENVKITYAAHSKSLFSVPLVNEKVTEIFNRQEITQVYEHVMKAIDPAKKIITFSTPEGDRELGYDFTNIIPPMRAPDVVRNSTLVWKDKWVDQGWVEVEKDTLRHRRFPNIFAIGDVAGVPKGKTAASVKWQVPVVEDHLVADIAGKEGTKTYNGYTSCPLITRVGRAMLVEFDYNNNLVPSFPGIIEPLEELWAGWLIKEVALKATYRAMLRGKA